MPLGRYEATGVLERDGSDSRAIEGDRWDDGAMSIGKGVP